MLIAEALEKDATVGVHIYTTSGRETIKPEDDGSYNITLNNRSDQIILVEYRLASGIRLDYILKFK